MKSAPSASARDIQPAAHAAVKKHLRPLTHRVRNRRQCVYSCRCAVKLTASVVGDHDPIKAERYGAPATSVAMLHAGRTMQR